MGDQDFISRSRDAGSEAVQRTQDALEQVVGQINRASEQLNKASEAQARQAQEFVQELLERGRSTSERLIESVDKELRSQIAVIRRDLEQLERRMAALSPLTHDDEPKPKSSAKKAPAKKTAAKKAAAKKAAPKSSEPAAPGGAGDARSATGTEDRLTTTNTRLPGVAPSVPSVPSSSVAPLPDTGPAPLPATPPTPDGFGGGSVLS